MNLATPGIDDVRALNERLRDWLVYTPMVRCRSLEYALGMRTEIQGKMEFLQQTGTFKPRGALSVMLELDAAQLQAGVTAVSAGNHAVATAYAAAAVGSSAKVVMTRTANPYRMERCKHYGAEVVLADDVHVAFEIVDKIQKADGRFFVHPYEGPRTFLGTATVGLEICEQLAEFDAIVIPIGGGGLCAGISSAVRQLNPKCRIIGVEPNGADSMRRSFDSGKPEPIPSVQTIADSLGAPFALPQSFELCRQNLDELVMIDDEQLKGAMGLLFHHMKMAVEPACAATTAALMGPLAGQFEGQTVVLVFCGSNIDWRTYQSYLVPEIANAA